MPCPLATWKHEKGHDSSPSFGIHVSDNDVSICNCLAGETEVITRDGIRLARDLAGTEPELLMPDGSWQRAPFRSFGRQRLYAIELKRNGVSRTIYATANHRWFEVPEGGGRQRERVTETLRPNAYLQTTIPARRQDWTLDKTGVLHGVMFGDGTARGAHGRVELFGEKRQLSRYLAGIATNRTEYPDKSALSGRFGFMKLSPEATSSDRYLLGFLAGYLATDGCVDERGLTCLNSARREDLEYVRDICLRLGIATYPINHQVRRGFGAEDTHIYRLNFVRSSLSPELFIRDDQRARFEASTNDYDRLRWRIVSVTPTNRREEVYCAEVEGHHAFVLGEFIVSGNCFTCHTKKPFHALIREYADYSGEDLDSLVREIEKEEFLGPRTLKGWDATKRARMEDIAMPIDEGIYMDLYPPAYNHPYVRGRGISEATARRLELLYDPGDTNSDRQKRILFPVRGPDGLLYGFSGRAVHKSAELKVRDYYGLKKAHCVLGSHLAVQDAGRHVLVVEGLFDYANAWECGQPGCAVMHSTMTDYQAAIFRDIGKKVYTFYDNDKAGKDGAATASKQLWRYLTVLNVKYPRVWIENPNEKGGGHWLKDPGEMLPEEFDEMIEKSTLYVDDEKPRRYIRRTR